MQSRIPLGNGNRFKDVMDYWQQIQERNMLSPLRAAQTQEAQSNATINRMKADLVNVAIKKALGGNTIANPNAATSVAPGAASNAVSNPNQSSYSGLSPDAAKQILIGLGYMHETPEDQSKRTLSDKAAEADITANEKKATEYKGTGEVVNKYAPNLEQIYNLLKTDPYVSGNTAKLRSFFNKSTKNQGNFISSSIPLIAPLSNDISKRGLATGVKFAGLAKPSTEKSIEENMGITENLIKTAINDFNTAKDNYEKMTGKEYPYKKADFLQNYENQKNNENVGVANGEKNNSANMTPTKENNSSVAILYKKDKNGKLKEYRIPGALVQQALREGFTSAS